MTKTIKLLNKVFQTYDLGCAAGLLSEHFKLLKLDKTNIKRVLFRFEYESGIEQAVADYFSGNFQVDAQAYFNHIKSLKNRIYSD